MAANVNSSEFTHATQLFADKTAANAWRTSMTVFDASTSTQGVVKQCTHVGDIAGSIGGVDIVAGASVTEPTTIGAVSATPSDAEVKVAFQALAEKINYLTYRLEQAGIMADS
jgi:hypothetical protein